MTAAESYADRIDAARRQSVRLRGNEPEQDRWSGPMARRFRADPHRSLDPNLAAIAMYVRPDDVLIDVGGGAGRLSLPLALRCREVVNVDPSPGMSREFTESAAEAGISNARLVQSDWLTAPDISGDVVLAANVTYFVREIVPFIEKLQTAARRLVILAIGSPPPPMQNTALFQLLHGEALEMVPGQPELLPVLWELGIVPDVRLLPEPFTGLGGPLQSHEAAVEFALQAVGMVGDARARETIGAHFNFLFDQTPAGLTPRWRPQMRQLLVLWRPDGATVDQQ
jgi:2-polyprenyl-3-methyl-5-hydroxy-6-metoxy-1,4-benzoquinol methylase